jgi:biopolymer transport protein ExbD
MKIEADNIESNEPRIELIPLIDVIFCILTFFLLAGLQVARQQAIDVDIPKASTGAPQARDLLMVSLSDTGQIFIEKQPIAAPELLAVSIEQYRKLKPNTSIVLYASKQVSYSKVVEILDLLRSVAGDRVSLATLPTNTIVTPSSPAPSPMTSPNIVPTVPTISPSSGTVYPGVPTISPSPAIDLTPALTPSIPSKSP